MCGKSLGPQPRLFLMAVPEAPVIHRPRTAPRASTSSRSTPPGCRLC
jgi:hypothetical protein